MLTSILFKYYQFDKIDIFTHKYLTYKCKIYEIIIFT